VKRHAFTLIELLVVIAIIAILAAILFPVFAQAKLAAKKTVSLSNAKQIALANMIYQNDYDDHLIKEYFGFPADCSSWGNTYYNWRFALQPYLAKSNGLITDPTSDFQAPNYWEFAWGDGPLADNIYLPSNYATNNAVIGFANGYCTGGATPVGMDTLDQLDDIAGTIIMLPTRAQWNDLKVDFISGQAPYSGGLPPSWCEQTPAGAATTTPACPAVGNGPINAIGKQAAFVWCDGHAKTKNVIATLRTNDPINDDWASKYTLYGLTNTNYTQVDRINIANTAYPEYK